MKNYQIVCHIRLAIRKFIVKLINAKMIELFALDADDLVGRE